MDGWINGWMDRLMDGWMNGLDSWINGFNKLNGSIEMD